MIRALYSAAGFVLTPLLHGWLNRRAARGREETARLPERFGHASVPRPPGPLIWLHAASVGETQSVLTLVNALLTQHPALNLLITTGTVTSAALVGQQALPRTIHQYIPVDTASAVRRFFAHWQPDVVLWVESEFWPQMLWQVQQHQIPMLLVNARLSEKSFRGWRRWPRTIHALLHSFTAIYAGSSDDAARLTQLGAEQVRDVGNLKYDAQQLPVDEALIAALRTAIGPRLCWVAASTHAGEEEIIARVQQRLQADFPDLLCLLIPRHATRGNVIATALRAQNYRVAQRSRGEAIDADTQFYLADTMGELGSFYFMAELVFLGGSLVEVGGHNPLEPARFGCALVTGPHIHNFTTMMQHLSAHDGLMMVENDTALIAAIGYLLREVAARHTLADNAQRVVNEARGASSYILQHVGILLKAVPS